MLYDSNETNRQWKCGGYIACALMLIGSVIGLMICHFTVPAKKEAVVIEQASPIKYEYLGNFEITYYIATGNKTATGIYPRSDITIAVDPKVIPYGTVVYIEGIGARVAEDCGGAVKNNVIDVFVDTTHQEAIKMGRKKLKVYKILNK